MNKFFDNAIKATLLTTLYISVLAACAGSGDPKVVKNASALTSPDTTDTNLRIETDSNSFQVNQFEKYSDDSEYVVPNETNTSKEDPEYLRSTTDRVEIPTQYTLYFLSDKSEVDTEDFIAMKHHAEFLLQNPDVIVSVNGHADSQGSESYNQTLSQKRADAIANLLILYGVPESQLILAAHGEAAPATIQSDWEANRRVELEYSNPVTLSIR